MSKEQLIYLLFLLLDLIIGGAVSPTLVSVSIGLGNRVYSVQLIVSCIIGVIYSIASTNLRKKKWMFYHYKAIDLSETAFYSLFNFAFLLIYFLGRYNPTDDWE